MCSVEWKDVSRNGLVLSTNVCTQPTFLDATVPPPTDSRLDGAAFFGVLRALMTFPSAKRP
jgi:hypothetical protein